MKLDPRLSAILAEKPEMLERFLTLAEPKPVQRVLSPEDMEAVLAPLLRGRENEAFVAVALDSRSRVIEAAILTTGVQDHALIDTRQVLRWVLTRKKPAAAFVIAHNHPSGDLVPSQPDLLATRRLRDAAEVIGIRLVDHLIITDDAYYSLATHGQLQ